MGIESQPRRRLKVGAILVGLCLACGLGAHAEDATLVPEGGACRYRVPADNSMGLTWTDEEFADNGWAVGTGGIGYETPAGVFSNLLGGVVPIQTRTVYARWSFALTNAPTFDALALRLQYDDGFVAYLNGTKVAAANAPDSPQYDSYAAAERLSLDALQPEGFDLTAFRDVLHAGTNVLAIHALNWNTGPRNSDLLIRPRLTAQKYAPASEGVLINEIHCHPDMAVEPVEFVELYNASAATVDLSGWYFSDGISYRFPPGASLGPRSFVVVSENPSAVSDKFGVASYGPFQGSLDNDGETVVLRNGLGEKVDEVRYQLGFPWPTVGDAPGPSMQLLNPTLDNDLGGSWRSAPPTPARSNAVLTAAFLIPPQVRQVEHSPKRPAAGQAVNITAKVTDPDGVSRVTLQYQLVDPGAYIAGADAAYAANWTGLEMEDDGSGGDALARDDLYTVTLPAALQTHRRLVRFRIAATDTLANSVRTPYADDPQPNFAYFVYDGVPAWTGAVQPGVTAPVVFGTNVMRSLPVYHLLSKKTDVENCTWIQKSVDNEYRWTGCLVYDGEVYDHIRYRARGGVWRYAMGKNMWKFSFNRGHFMEMRDNYGQKYPVKYDNINLGACIQQGHFGHRGEHGLFEAVGFRLFNLAGVPASSTHWIQFRIIDESSEFGANQYTGDFWGLYLSVEQVDGHFLDAHNLPDGNLYRIEGAAELQNQGPTGVTNGSDYAAFKSAYSNQPPASWWQTNVTVDAYHGFRAICDGIHHYDIGAGKNYFFYLNPVNNLWTILPWDLDLTWADNMWDSGNLGAEPFKANGLWTAPELLIQRNNRIREIRDLLFNTNETWRLIDEYARAISGSNGLSMADADRTMWDYNPVMTNTAYCMITQAGHGQFYQAAPARDFPGMVTLMKDYVVYRSTGTLDPLAADAAIPYTPTISAVSNVFPVNRLTFRCSPFNSPQGSNTFAAMKWRMAEITDPSAPGYDPGAPQAYEINAAWESAELTNFADTVTVPPAAARIGRMFRVRARMMDNAGRWSHWSEPVQFRAAEPDNSTALVDHLRVTEVMYNPPAGSDFEFVELLNTSSNLTLDLLGVKITDGIDYTFPAGTAMPPRSYLLVVRATNANNFAVFRQHYRLADGVPMAGPYQGSLNNDGEKLTMRTASAGAVIFSATYSDGRGWPLSPDGAGHSLVALVTANQAGGALDYGRHWRASVFIGGSPGRPDPEPPADVVVNEVMAHTDYLTAYDSDDWIELYNPTGAALSLGDWYLSDSAADLRKWRIPSTNVIAAYDRLTFHEVTDFHFPTNVGFGLDKKGEQVFLSYLPGNTNDRVADCVAFKGQENFMSWGRSPDGSPWWYGLAPPTTNAPNPAPPPRVVISEIMYHPAPTPAHPENNVNDEYLEICNPTGNRVDLWNSEVGPWRIDGGVDYLFPTNTSLAPGECLAVVSFDPLANPTALQEFRSAHNVGANPARVLGPFNGALANGGERVALERGVGPDLPGEPISWAIVDEVIYFDQDPWPALADGAGFPLQRVSMIAAGNDPANWSAGYVATPGLPPVDLAHASPYGEWSRKMPIRFAGYGRTEPLRDFPALVVFGTNLPGFSYSQFASAAGGDLRFANATELRTLNFEIERWDPAGESFVWVQVPELVGTDTTVWAYWGHSTQTNPPAGCTNGAVWSAGYAGVWHLANTQAYDSSGNGRHGTAYGVTPSVGRIDGALAYGGASSVLVPGYTPSAQTLTVTAWVWANVAGVGNTIAKNWGSATAGQFQLGLDSNYSLSAGIAEAGGRGVTNREPGGARHPFPSLVWCHVALVADGAKLRLYRDGAEVGTPANYDGTLKTNFTDLGIGVRPNDSGGVYGERWAGVVDDITVARVARSSNWIWACWMNTASNAFFARYGQADASGMEDLNGNGIPDAWERVNFGELGAPEGAASEDWDGDRVDNRGEYVAGTEPTNADSVLALWVSNANGNAMIGWQGRKAAGQGYAGLTRFYDLWQAPSLLNAAWRPVPAFSNFSPYADGAVIWTNADSDRGFYRLKVRLE